MYDVTYDEPSYGAAAGLSAGWIVFCLVVSALIIAANWKIFTKAGRPGWMAIVPILNIYELFDIAWGKGVLFLLMFVPFANIVVSIMVYIKLAHAFGKGGGFAAGLIFLNPIFMLILGFGEAQYIGPDGTPAGYAYGPGYPEYGGQPYPAYGGQPYQQPADPQMQYQEQPYQGQQPYYGQQPYQGQPPYPYPQQGYQQYGQQPVSQQASPAGAQQPYQQYGQQPYQGQSQQYNGNIRQ